jgi:hypothetical protein
MSGRLTPSRFIQKAKEIHGDTYDYSKIVYVHSQEKIPIICKIHGEFQQRPQKHLMGQGCPLCRFEKTASKERLTKDEFIDRAVKIHGQKYDYSKVEYINNHTKVLIICPEHGAFEMLPSNHTHGTKPQGCPECGGRRHWTKESFIKEAIKVHKNKYSYYKVRYDSPTKLVTIICPIHGDFSQKPSKHLAGQGCPVCAGTKKKSTEEFIELAKKIHGEKYIYDEVVYETTLKKVKIICPEHGIFEMSPANHIYGKKPQGCPRCSGKKIFDTKDFISYATEIHEGLYSYDLTKYIDSKTPVRIICPYHGEFLQKPSVHLLGCGCSRCRSPRGENRIQTLLKKMNIPHENQYSFSDCKYINPLFFDFKIDVGSGVALIEYNGEQHYREFANDIFNYEEIQIRDKIKKKYCSENNIPLLEIPYNQYDSIEDLLHNFIANLKSPSKVG